MFESGTRLVLVEVAARVRDERGVAVSLTVKPIGPAAISSFVAVLAMLLIVGAVFTGNEIMKVLVWYPVCVAFSSVTVPLVVVSKKSFEVKPP